MPTVNRANRGSTRTLAVLAATLFAGFSSPLGAQSVPPISLSRLPHIAIISPTFYWDDKADVVRTISATCPDGRPIAGGLSIEKGNASLRMRESYPDGASWVVRAFIRRNPLAGEPLQVRAFAVCLLPVARGDSVQIAQYPRLLRLSHQFTLAPGDTPTAERQPCARDGLVISGGLGLDPEFKGVSYLRMELNYPDKWAWNVRAINGGARDRPAAVARVYSICLAADDSHNGPRYRTVFSMEATVTVKAGDSAVREAIQCRDAAAHAISGGARLLRGKNAAIEIQESFPDTPGSWTTAVTNRSPSGIGDATVRLYAICIGP